MAYPARQEVLIADLAAARSELIGYGRALRRDLDVRERVLHDVRAHPGRWFCAAALLGLLLSRLAPLQRKAAVKPSFFRRPPVKQAIKGSLAPVLVKFALDLVNPLFAMWVKRRLFDSSGLRDRRTGVQ